MDERIEAARPNICIVDSGSYIGDKSKLKHTSVAAPPPVRTLAQYLFAEHGQDLCHFAQCVDLLRRGQRQPRVSGARRTMPAASVSRTSRHLLQQPLRQKFVTRAAQGHCESSIHTAGEGCARVCDNSGVHSSSSSSAARGDINGGLICQGGRGKRRQVVCDRCKSEAIAARRLRAAINPPRNSSICVTTGGVFIEEAHAPPSHLHKLI